MRRALALATLISVGACTPALAQSSGSGIPQIGNKRSYQVDIIADLLYDSNVAHSNEVQAAARGIHPEDETARPRISLNVTQPIGRQALFVNGAVGYDFHRYNKELDHLNADITAGAALSAASCRALPFGSYQASQANPEDVPGGGSANNLLSTATGSFALECGRETGLSEQVLYQHVKADNSNPKSEPANHVSDSVSGGVSYGNQSLGTLGLVASYAQTNYPNRQAALGVNGDEITVQSYGVTYTRQFGARLKAQASVSDAIVQRKHAPAGLPLTTSGINYSANVAYQFGRNLGITIQGSRAYKPSNQPGKLYELMTGWEGDVSYQLGQRILLGLGSTYKSSVANVDTTIPEPLPTRYHQTAVYASASYRQSRRASLNLEVRQEDKTTNIPSFDYSDTRVTLSLDVSL